MIDPEKKRTIYLLTDTYWPIQGGVEETVRTLAAEIPHPYDLQIITHAGPRSYGRSLHGFCAPQPFSCYADPAGRKVIPLLPDCGGRVSLFVLHAWELPGVRRKNAPHLFDALYWFYRKAYFPKLVRLLKDAALVHCFSTGYLARSSAEVCAHLAIPLVLTPAVHFGSWGDSPGQIDAYAKAKMIICPTGLFKKQLFEKMAPRQPEAVVIPPFIREPSATMEQPRGVDAQKKFVLFLGRREPYKGLDALIESLAMAGWPADLVIAGPVHGSPKVQRENVIDLGEVGEPVKQWLLANCTLLCVPSENESFGMVYAEAMQCGKPVVALDIGALRELVEEGVTGLLVPPGNIKALAEAVTAILSDHDLQERMGAAARKRFDERYAVGKSLAKIAAVYERVAG